MIHPSAAQIRAVREQAGLSPVSVAAKLGIDMHRYLDIEQGLAAMDLPQWCQMQSLTYRFKAAALRDKTPYAA
ncbi:MAG: helix-turn-helix domain-containing protein [Pseudomonadota bacterium]